MVPGCEGIVFTAIASVRSVPLPQAFDGITVTFPEAAPAVAVMEFVPWPAVIDQPEGTAHV